MDRSVAFVVEFICTYVWAFVLAKSWSNQMLLQSRVVTGICGRGRGQKSESKANGCE